MNYKLPYIPERPEKPRNTGINMIMDKGLSLREAENFISANGELTDLVKLGFGTSYITNNLKEKIKLYKEANIKTYFGGTLFEAFIIRGMFDDYRKLLDEYQLDMAEISDGSYEFPHEDKCKYISELSKQVTVLSEVGTKIASKVIPTEQWISMMETELEAGSWKVIAEARESGTIGIYKSDGTSNDELINSIRKNIDNDKIIWEAPIKSQQAWFIKLLGSNVNLGNIAPNEVIALETLRLGLRGDTFFQFLPDDLKK